MIKQHQMKWSGDMKSLKDGGEALKSDKKAIHFNREALQGNMEALKDDGRR